MFGGIEKKSYLCRRTQSAHAWGGWADILDCMRDKRR